MIWYLVAVLFGSFTGSVHCVGMCGPMAILVHRPSGGAGSRFGYMPHFAYHVGRLTTYLSIGFLVGAIGSVIDSVVEQWNGIAIATSIAGWMMIGVGLLAFARPKGETSSVHSNQGFSGWMGKRISHLFRAVGTDRPILRGFVLGFATTWLPCGWLYTFALVAAGAGSVAAAMITMSAFWLGTVPALSAMSLAWSKLAPSLRALAPRIAAASLIVFGVVLVMNRSGAGIQHWIVEHRIELQSRSSKPLKLSGAFQPDELPPPPCCEANP